MDATCSFSVAGWEEKPYQQIPGNRKLTEASVAFDLKGGIEGKATVRYLMAYTEVDATDPHKSAANYVGLMRIEGSLAGKKGSFVLEDRGVFRGMAQSELRIVAGSGTDDLAGIAGAGKYGATEHGATLELHYTL